jgi:hypothetical protein
MKKVSSLVCFFLLVLTTDIRSQELANKHSKLEKDFASFINLPDIGEAYPYLSADGLRLYFTSDREGSFGRIYFCSRKSVNENFDKPIAVGKNIVDGYFCSTLTADELTMYMAKEGEIYVSKRKSMNDEFSRPQMIEGLVSGFKFAPTISPDGNEMILVKDLSANNYQTFVYRKTGDHNFTQTGTLAHPKGILGGGQFSKDGLDYYVAYETFDSIKGDVDNLESITMTLVKYTRKTLNSDFEKIEDLPSAVNATKRNHQPTVNGDGTIMVIVNTEKYDWRYNELRLVNLEKEIVIEDSFVIVCDCNYVDEVILESEAKVKVDTFFEVYPYSQLTECRFDSEIITEDQFVINDSLIELATSKSTIPPEIASQVKVYPNPFTDNIVITLEKNDINSNFELFDIAGRKIMTSKLNNSVNRIQFNKPGAGIYIYRLTNSNGKVFATGKLVRK